MSARAAALLILLLLPTVAAQGLPGAPPPCGPLGVSATVPGELAPDQEGTVSITVTNAGQRPVRANVAFALLSPTQGWAGGGDQAVVVPAATSSAAGSAKVDFVVRASGDAQRSVSASFTASGACDEPVPGICAQAPQACTAAEVSGTQTLTYRGPPQGLSIPFLENLNIRPEVAIAAVVLVAILATIPFLLRKRPIKGVAAECPEPLKMLKPGKGASFPIELRNGGSEATRAEMEVGPVPEGWSAFLPLPDMQLAPREARSLFLMVRAPEDASPGDAIDVELSVRTASRPDRPSYVRVRAEVAPS